MPCTAVCTCVIIVRFVVLVFWCFQVQIHISYASYSYSISIKESFVRQKKSGKNTLEKKKLQYMEVRDLHLIRRGGDLTFLLYSECAPGGQCLRRCYCARSLLLRWWFVLCASAAEVVLLLPSNPHTPHLRRKVRRVCNITGTTAVLL